MIVMTDPKEVRKAAAFVEAIAKVERDFGMVVHYGLVEYLQRDVEHGAEAVTFGPNGDSRYVVCRRSGEPGDLTLALDG